MTATTATTTAAASTTTAATTTATAPATATATANTTNHNAPWYPQQAEAIAVPRNKSNWAAMSGTKETMHISLEASGFMPVIQWDQIVLRCLLFLLFRLGPRIASVAERNKGQLEEFHQGNP